MAEQQNNDRTESARRHDDSAMIENAQSGASGAGRSGGRVATDVGTRDEEKRALEPDAGTTAPHKSDEKAKFIPTRADNDGANG